VGLLEHESLHAIENIVKDLGWTFHPLNGLGSELEVDVEVAVQTWNNHFCFKESMR
jgi:hypothetical protein